MRWPGADVTAGRLSPRTSATCGKAEALPATDSLVDRTDRLKQIGVILSSENFPPRPMLSLSFAVLGRLISFTKRQLTPVLANLTFLRLSHESLSHVFPAHPPTRHHDGASGAGMDVITHDHIQTTSETRKPPRGRGLSGEWNLCIIHASPNPAPHEGDQD
jgi:hypothetical protein